MPGARSAIVLTTANIAATILTSAAQAQTGVGLGGFQSDAGHQIAVDSDDNIYIVSQIRQSVDFDPGPGVVSVDVGGTNTLALSSYLPTGVLRYAFPLTRISSTLPESGLAVDGAGNAYVTGGFSGVVDFDPGAEENILSSQNGNLFVASYDATGNHRFAFNIGVGAPFFEAGKAVIADSAGNLWITGEFSGVTDFDPTEDGEFLLAAEGGNDVFLAGYTSTGNLRFAIGMGGTMRDRGLDLAVDTAGNSYITGAFRGTADFDPGPGTFNLTANGTTEDMFLASYNNAGGFRYALSAGASATDIGWGVDVDNMGNAFVTGEFSGTVDFDPGPGVVNVDADGAPNKNIFVASYDDQGGLRFAFGMGAGADELGRSTAVRADGSFYVTGSFNTGIDFDPGPGEFILPAATGDAFLAHYANNGALIFADSLSPIINGAASGNDLALTSDGTPALTGTFSGAVDLDLGAGELNVTSVGANDIFFTTLTVDVDTDGDGIVDGNDNCTQIFNPDQRNTNSDPFGNACDPDLNNDGIVNVVDLGALRAVFFTDDDDADFNGDGVVNVVDLGVMRSFFFLPPGPSGLGSP